VDRMACPAKLLQGRTRNKASGAVSLGLNYTSKSIRSNGYHVCAKISCLAGNMDVRGSVSPTKAGDRFLKLTSIHHMERLGGYCPSGTIRRHAQLSLHRFQPSVNCSQLSFREHRDGCVCGFAGAGI